MPLPSTVDYGHDLSCTLIDTTLPFPDGTMRTESLVDFTDDFAAFWQDLEWMGVQRHLKVLGIFARICYRDGKPAYLADTPRFETYVRNNVLATQSLLESAQQWPQTRHARSWSSRTLS